MSDIVSFIDHVLRRYIIDERNSFIYLELGNDLNRCIQQYELGNSWDDYSKAYEILGGDDFLFENYVKKYDMVRFLKRDKAGISRSLVISTLSIPFCFFVSFVTILYSFQRTSFFNYRGNFLFFDSMNVYEMLLLYLILVCLVYFFGSLYLSISHKYVSTRVNRVVAIVILILSFPLGLLNLKYLRLISQYTDYEKSDKIVISSLSIISLLIVMFVWVSMIPFFSHNSAKYEYQKSNHYVIYDHHSLLYDQFSYLEGANTMFSIQYNDETGSVYSLHFDQLSVDIESMDLADNSQVYGEVFINDYALCEDKVNLIDSSYNQLYCHSSNENYKILFTSDEFDANRIEVSIKITYTNSSNIIIEDVAYIFIIEDLEEYQEYYE